MRHGPPGLRGMLIVLGLLAFGALLVGSRGPYGGASWHDRENMPPIEASIRKIEGLCGILGRSPTRLDPRLSLPKSGETRAVQEFGR